MTDAARESLRLEQRMILIGLEQSDCQWRHQIKRDPPPHILLARANLVMRVREIAVELGEPMAITMRAWELLNDYNPRLAA